MAARSALLKTGLWAGLVAGGPCAVVLCADDSSKYFDPEALERGAKALREINTSPYAKKASLPQGLRTQGSVHASGQGHAPACQQPARPHRRCTRHPRGRKARR